MPLTPWDAAAVAVKAVVYASTLSAAGAVFFLRYNRKFLTADDRRLIGWWWVGTSLVALAASGVEMGVIAGSMGDDASSMASRALMQLVWNAGHGRAVEIRVTGLALAALAWRSEHRSWGLSIAGAALAATSFAWLGHARELAHGSWPVVLISVHLLAVAFWVGALVPLLIVARRGDALVLARIADRFSAIALFAVAALIIAGVSLLCFLLLATSELWTSAYGRYVSWKLIFVAGLLCCAALNKWRLTPGLKSRGAGALGSLRASIWLEIVLCVLILTVTALFTTVAGPPVLE